jgi:hypothetical protein
LLVVLLDALDVWTAESTASLLAESTVGSLVVLSDGLSAACSAGRLVEPLAELSDYLAEPKVALMVASMVELLVDALVVHLVTRLAERMDDYSAD